MDWQTGRLAGWRAGGDGGPVVQADENITSRKIKGAGHKRWQSKSIVSDDDRQDESHISIPLGIAIQS